METAFFAKYRYPLPSRLAALYAQLDNGSFPSVDLEVPSVDAAPLDGLVEPAHEKALVPLLLHGSGSVIAAVRQPGIDRLEELPIAWIDSEGSPAAVFAANLEELFAQLHISIGYIYDMLSAVVSFRGEPDWYSDPAETYSPSEMQRIASEEWAESEGYAALHLWLTETLSVPYPEDPFSPIKAANDRWGDIADLLG